MPRLSVIIPHRHDDQRLEATLLSVLENRPKDCEVIVVHDGSYRDPYRLGDEVVFVDADRCSHPVELVNAGVLAACSPVVNTLLDGVLVSEGWTEHAEQQLAMDEELAAVAVPIQWSASTGSVRISLGVDQAALMQLGRLRSGRVQRTSPSSECAGPELACGFFRRTVLLALEGFADTVCLRTAAVEFAASLQELELPARCLEFGGVSAEQDGTSVAEDVAFLAQLAVRRGLLKSGWLSSVQEFLTMGMSRPQVVRSWVSGMSREPKEAQRVRRASAKLAARREQVSQSHEHWTPTRRAA